MIFMRIMTTLFLFMMLLVVPARCLCHLRSSFSLSLLFIRFGRSIGGPGSKLRGVRSLLRFNPVHGQTL
jgi:hypothetical protein